MNEKVPKDKLHAFRKNTREKREYERKGEKLTGNGKRQTANRINYLMEMKN